MTRQSPIDPFEEEIRHALADEAGQPVPQRLVARVAAISSQGRPGRAPMTRLRTWLTAGPGTGGPGPRLALGGGLIALAIVAVTATVLIAAPGLGPGSSPAPSRLPSSAPSTTPSAPAGSPLATPEAAMPSTAPAPSAAAVGSPIPAGFEPSSVTFVSADRGWVLGGAPCPGGTCAAIVRTTDGGRTWDGNGAPATMSDPSEATGGGVTGLRFANARDGWAFGSELWSTHDGGATWRRVAIPGLAAGFQVLALETAGAVVHAAVFDGGGSFVRIASSPVGDDAWATSSATVPLGAGPVPSAQIVLHGTAGWLVVVNRVVVGGARLIDGAWQAWRPPCFDSDGPTTLAASTARDLVAACDVGLWSSPSGVQLFTSTDRGTSFTQAAPGVPVVPVSILEGIAAPTKDTVVVGGRIASGDSGIVASFDAGGSWVIVLSVSGGGSLSDLGFTTADQGVVIARSDGGSRLFMTRDGGRSWAATLPGS